MQVVIIPHQPLIHNQHKMDKVVVTYKLLKEGHHE